LSASSIDSGVQIHLALEYAAEQDSAFQSPAKMLNYMAGE
jgi:hypothetical protein